MIASYEIPARGWRVEELLHTQKNAITFQVF